MSTSDDLRETPVRRWQCGDGCMHLLTKTGAKAKHYACGFWVAFHGPLAKIGVGSWPTPLPCTCPIPRKRIEGPHTDEPVKLCPHFAEGDAS